MAERARILVLGARGFVGSHLVLAATQAGFEVVTASREPDRADLVADLLDPSSLGAALAEARPGVVVNLGAQASVAASWNQPDAGRGVNVEGVANLLRAAGGGPGPPRIVCLSSAEVYGEVPEEAMPITESTPLRPVTPYGRSKVAMEAVCGHDGGELGLGIAVVRSFNQLGPGQPSEYVSAGIARQIATAEAQGLDRVVVTVGNPAASRDFTDVRDGARALVAICEHEVTGTFNICSGNATRVAELVSGLAEHAAIPVEVALDESFSRPADVPVMRGSAERLRDATGWAPEVPLDRSLADLLDSWRGRVG